MSDLRIRVMTPSEFDVFRRRTISEYAAEHVRAGNWSPDQAERLAAKETDDLLPHGVNTSGMLLLVGENASAEVVGLVWVALAFSPTSKSIPDVLTPLGSRSSVSFS